MVAKGRLLQAPIQFQKCLEKIAGNLKEQLHWMVAEKANWLQKILKRGE